jgi:hypothetical protein
MLKILSRDNRLPENTFNTVGTLRSSMIVRAFALGRRATKASACDISHRVVRRVDDPRATRERVAAFYHCATT